MRINNNETIGHRIKKNMFGIEIIFESLKWSSTKFGKKRFITKNHLFHIQDEAVVVKC